MSRAGRFSSAYPLWALALPLVLIAVPVVVHVCGAHPPAPGDPLPGLTRDERARFEAGRAVFGREFTPETGLGPLFNAPSCAECHEEPVAGGAGDEVEVHASALAPGGACDPLFEQGGPVVQIHVTRALGEAFGIEEEPVPPGATATARRTSRHIFGFGLLDAVPDATILARADPGDRDGDGVSGRPNRFVDGRLGRFGRKAFVPTLREFNDVAFLLEQGVTSPAALLENTVAGIPLPAGVDPAPDPEIDQPTLDLADAFVRLLAPPAPVSSWRFRPGRRVFAAIGCDACHIPSLDTGDHPVRALRRRSVHAYTDLLIHDMGPDLADICLGEASPSEFRTEPLMGLRFAASFLHDGRAATVEHAIRLHGGEAAGARDRFLRLTADERATLVRFLESL